MEGVILESDNVVELLESSMDVGDDFVRMSILDMLISLARDNQSKVLTTSLLYSLSPFTSFYIRVPLRVDPASVYPSRCASDAASGSCCLQIVAKINRWSVLTIHLCHWWYRLAEVCIASQTD